MTDVFNPLDIENLGLSVLTAILKSEPTPLAEVGIFTGAGIYVIYYTGDHPAYTHISAANADGKFSQPIYVGKAIPAGGRKGIAVATNTNTKQLSARIREHARSIQAAKDLNIEDFCARWLIVEPIWIPLGESLMISRNAPVWNALVDGFGNHDPGAGRISGVRSRWDTLHPGRAWAIKYPERPETAEQIQIDTSEYLRQRLQTAMDD
jgi:hypothetical protein